VALRQVSPERTRAQVPRSVVVAAGDRENAAVRAAADLATGLGAELHVVPAADAATRAGELPDPLVCLPALEHRRRPGLGPMAATVLRDVGAPLLVVGPGWSGDISGDRLLLYSDGSEASRVAAAVAIGWAGRLGLDLWILGVVAPAGRAELGAADLELLASGHLALLARQVARAGGQAQWDVLHGPHPEAAIADHARRTGAALIVVGVDSVPAAAMVPRLVERSPVPVLIVPEDATAPVSGFEPPRPPRRLERPPLMAIPTRLPPPAVLVRLPEPEPVRRRAPGRRAAVVAATLGVLAMASAHLTVPYYSFRPGETRAVQIEGAPSYPTGRILFTTASIGRATVAGAVRGWIDGDVDVVPAGRVHGSQRLNRGLMADSKIIALAVALHRLGYRLPVRAQIDSGDVIGPSAGLAFTLALLDRLTPGDLTGGRPVAVTGTIALDGTVGPVGAVGQKVASARRAGAEVMLVPRSAYTTALRNRGTMQVVPVGTLAEALAAMARLGGEPIR
jgi:Lon protease-like protein/universal stress protein family protein